MPTKMKEPINQVAWCTNSSVTPGAGKNSRVDYSAVSSPYGNGDDIFTKLKAYKQTLAFFGTVAPVHISIVWVEFPTSTTPTAVDVESTDSVEAALKALCGSDPAWMRYKVIASLNFSTISRYYTTTVQNFGMSRKTVDVTSYIKAALQRYNLGEEQSSLNFGVAVIYHMATDNATLYYQWFRDVKYAPVRDDTILGGL